MTSKPTVFAREFHEPWPDVLMAMRLWIREQVSLTGGAAQYEVQLSFSRPELLAARRSGIAMQPALDDFLRSVLREYGISIPRPDERQGLHEDGPHRVRFHYWR